MEEGNITYHSTYVRCPVCGNATVGLHPPYTIFHLCDGSMARTPKQDREVTRLLVAYDRAVATRQTCLQQEVEACAGLAELGIEITKIRPRHRKD